MKYNVKGVCLYLILVGISSNLTLGYSRKKQTGGGGTDDMEFPTGVRLLKK